MENGFGFDLSARELDSTGENFYFVLWWGGGGKVRKMGVTKIRVHTYKISWQCD